MVHICVNLLYTLHKAGLDSSAKLVYNTKHYLTAGYKFATV